MGLRFFALTGIYLCLALGSGEVAAFDKADSEKLEPAVEDLLSRYLDVPAIANGRLTLTSGTPITSSDVTGATVIYFTPYNGSKISLYDGTRWKLYNFSELSLSLGTISNATNYDVYLYDNSGTLTMELLAWTNDSTRATALVLQDGIYLKTGALTRRYLGTIRTTSTTTTEDSRQNRLVWNNQNRVQRYMYYTPGNVSWSYSNFSWRPSNNNTTYRLGAVVGVFGSAVDLTFHPHTYSAGTPIVNNAICEDCTNNFTVQYGEHSVTGYNSSPSRIVTVPAAGYHYYQLMEYANGVHTYTANTAAVIGFVDA